MLKVAGIAAVVGVIIALTTPKQYTVSVTLAPEMSKGGSSSLSGIASMLGVGGFNMGNDADALNVTLYPDIVSSTPFILDLMDTPVSMLDEEKPDTTLVGYLEEYTSGSLINSIISLPFKAIGGVMSLFKSEDENEVKIILGVDPNSIPTAQGKGAFVDKKGHIHFFTKPKQRQAEETFKNKHIEYTKIKKHLEYINSIENIIKNLR